MVVVELEGLAGAQLAYYTHPRFPLAIGIH